MSERRQRTRRRRQNVRSVSGSGQEEHVSGEQRSAGKEAAASETEERVMAARGVYPRSVQLQPTASPASCILSRAKAQGMANTTRRPLPTPPSTAPALYTAYTADNRDIYSLLNPYHAPHPVPPPFTSPSADVSSYDEPTTTLRGGTLLHKGFYDLLALIPTPSPSRLLWGADPTPDTHPVVAGPRYEDIPASRYAPARSGAALPASILPASIPPVSPVSPRKGRRISKDMVSKPTGFVHLVHASDADQAEALLTRWGPDRQGKLGGEALDLSSIRTGANPHALRSSLGEPHQESLTTAARENERVSPIDGLPGRPGNSTIRWTAGLVAHAEHEHEDDPASTTPSVPEPPPRTINPSLATMEKAVSARIFFENLYFPLLRQPPSREQRRLAMEQDMASMGLPESRKEQLRARWRQNETDYLRDKRRKVDVSAFIKLKTIGHGAFGVVSLVKERSSGQLFAMKQLRKTDMLRKGQEGHVRAERDVLKSASLVSSPGGAEWIVRLHYSFQDRDNLYLVLEYMGGGDLLNLLIERDVFPEDFTRFYVAEMVLAIESCHKHGFIHRDIKPDNFFFDSEAERSWACVSADSIARVSGSSHELSRMPSRLPALIFTGSMTHYEQQWSTLLQKHGIDLEDSSPGDGHCTMRMNRKDMERLMDGVDGAGGIFT
ncbi:hypothetical protein EVG20_g7382 [Dentipellis fragilis]|uniref:non-specific serine/threonine protein kinase n=1 Tax=Dentipellis fragilis TaxID=205917 RepID=A0A4Y9YGH5_9AGAM|nr:hypothetical protein EVG20_g7382 [Dentipellis fragilis]